MSARRNTKPSRRGNFQQGASSHSSHSPRSMSADHNMDHMEHFIATTPSPSTDLTSDHGMDTRQTGTAVPMIYSDTGVGVYYSEKPAWEFTDPACNEAVRQELLARVTDFWPEYTSIPKETKDEIYAAFLARFHWHPQHSAPHLVRKAFNRQASIKYRDFTHGMSNKKEKSEACPAEVFERFKAHWETPEFIAKSQKSKASRAANPRLHTGGRRSFSNHANDMFETSQSPPTSWQLYCRTHKSDSDSGSAGWVDENARLFAEAYEAELQRQRESGVEVNTEVENTVYKQISSSLKKRRDRVPYTGNIPQASAPRPRNAPFSSTIPNYETMRTQMEAQYKQAMDAHLQQMQETLQKTIQETMQQQQVYMRQTLQEEMKKWSKDMEQRQNDMSDDDA